MDPNRIHTSGIKRRQVLQSISGGTTVLIAGCSQFQSSQPLSLGMIRVVNLVESELDVNVSTSPYEKGDAYNKSKSLGSFNDGGNAHAEELVFHTDNIDNVSRYDYTLSVEGEKVRSIDGEEIKERYDEFDEDACVVIHWIVNSVPDDIFQSSELKKSCDLPE